MSQLPKNTAEEKDLFLEKLIRAARGGDERFALESIGAYPQVRKVLTPEEALVFVRIFGAVQPEKTRLIPKDWKPRNAAHAIECLQFWIDCIDGRRNLRDFIRELGKEHFAQTSMKGLVESLSIVEGFVDGAKAVLQNWVQVKGRDSFELGVEDGQNRFLMAMVQAYAPRMAEAGFEVPK